MVLLLLGDSQVQRIWPSVRLDREILRDAIYFPVKNRDAIVSGYQSITASVNMVILSFLTNVIVDTLGEDSNEACLNQLFIELFTQSNGLFSFCSTFPTVRVFLAPPNVRLRPNWYSRLRPTIIRVLHQFLQTRPVNLQMESDGKSYCIKKRHRMMETDDQEALSSNPGSGLIYHFSRWQIIKRGLEQSNRT